MPKYDVTVTEVKTFTVGVSGRNEDEARTRGIAVVREAGPLDSDATIPVERKAEYSATARLSR